ncbi:MAG: hypothetical protein RL173_41 [Fibrobacterota bacterium]|jgi:hypothetical protein
MYTNNISSTSGVIAIDSANISDYVRDSDDPVMSALSIGLRMPAGVSVDDLLANTGRARQHARRHPKRDEHPLTIAVDNDVLVVTGRLPRWEASTLSKHKNEFSHYCEHLRDELSKLAKPGVDVTLVPESVRGVTYTRERGLTSESALRDVFEYWRVHLFLDTMYSGSDFVHAAVPVRDEDSFGWSNGDCELRFRWVSKAEAVANDWSRCSLISCEVSCNPTGMASLLERATGVKVEEITGLGAEVVEAMLSSLQLSDTQHDDCCAHLGEILDPVLFFLGRQR